MSNMPGIDITVKSDKVELMVGRVAKALKPDVSYAAAVYLVGNMGRGLKHYRSYKHVTRKAAYGKTFQSDKQRRYVMAMIKQGKITPGYPKRTGKAQRGWKARPISGGDSMVSNDVPYIGYLHDNDSQARLNALAGWRKVEEIIESNTRGMLNAGEQAIKRVTQA